MKTKEELNELKKEVAELNKKLSALPEEELGQVVGGLADDIPPRTGILRWASIIWTIPAISAVRPKAPSR